MPDFLKSLTNGFMPHGFCLRWDPALLWTMILANLGIALSYFCIPLALWYFVRKRKDLPYPWMFRLFAVFITACGMTHVMKTLTIFQAFYWPEALIDLFTAGVSLLTALLLWPIIPRALSLRSPKELEQVNQQLQSIILTGKQSEQRFRGLLESAPDATIVVDQNGKIIIVNSQTEKVFGYQRKELVGQTVEMLIPERFREEITGHHDGFYTNPRLWAVGAGIKLYGLSKDGIEFPVDLSLGPIETEEGLLMSISVRDVTERQKHEQMRAQLAAIVESSDDAIISKTLDDVITTWNRGAEALFGYTAEEIIGKPGSVLIPSDQADDEQAILARVIAGERIDRYEAVRQTKDGKLIDVWLKLSPIKTLTGKIVGIAKIVRDITELKAAEAKQTQLNDELKRSNAELQRFAYIAAHDLREPLRTIASYTGLLAEQFSSTIDPDTQENIDFVISATKRMQQLIDDLLSYSRIHTHGKELQQTDCSKLLDKIVSLFQVTIEEAGARVTHGDLPVVLADASQLEQVFSNLIANALKFRSPEPPYIHIAAKFQNNDWLFSIQDNGIGIDMQHRERIFDMFQRLHTIDEYPGTGIGLSLCRRIIERHGGKIWVESELGKGSTFWFILPASKA